MKKVLLIFAALLMYSGAAVAQEKTEKKATLSGRIWNIDTGKPLNCFAYLILVDSTGVQRYGANTNGEGEYRIEGITPEKYTFMFSCLGCDRLDIVVDIKDEKETLSFGVKERDVILD